MSLMRADFPFIASSDPTKGRAPLGTSAHRRQTSEAR